MRNHIMAKKQNKGSAMIVAIVVSLITMVLAMSLLLLAYSVHASVLKEGSRLQCKELAYSVSSEIQKELTVDFDSYEEQRDSLTDGQNPLWALLRYQIWQEDERWPYFNEDENQHKKSAAYRYFKLQTDGGEVEHAADQILVTMYWDGSYETQKAFVKDGTILHVKVEVFKDEEYFANNMTFALEISDYEDVEEGVVENNGQAIIMAREKWTWVKE